MLARSFEARHGARTLPLIGREKESRLILQCCERAMRGEGRVVLGERGADIVPYHCIVLVKQVPDTANVTAEAMRADGTVNRGALPTISASTVV